MQIYGIRTLGFDDGYQSLHPIGDGPLARRGSADTEAAELALNAGDESFLDHWGHQQVRWSGETYNLRSDPQIRADFPATIGYLTMSAKARTVLRPPLDDSVEWLPTHEADGTTWWILNVMDRVDIFDAERTIGTRYPGGEFMVIEQAVMRSDVEPRSAIFREPQYPWVLFCIPSVVSAVEDARLTGLVFKPVQMFP